MNFSRKKVSLLELLFFQTMFLTCFLLSSKITSNFEVKYCMAMVSIVIPLSVLKSFSIELVVLWMNIAMKWKPFSPPNKELESSFEIWRLWWIWLKYIFTLIYLHFNPKCLLWMCIVYSMQFIPFHHPIFCILCFVCFVFCCGFQCFILT